MKAYFKLQKDFLSHNPNIGTSIHVFDHTIKPILPYGSEIWGSFNTQTAKFKNGRQITLDHFFNNLMCEKLHIKFGKFLEFIEKPQIKLYYLKLEDFLFTLI